MGRLPPNRRRRLLAAHPRLGGRGPPGLGADRGDLSAQRGDVRVAPAAIGRRLLFAPGRPPMPKQTQDVEHAAGSSPWVQLAHFFSGGLRVSIKTSTRPPSIFDTPLVRSTASRWPRSTSAPRVTMTLPISVTVF